MGFGACMRVGRRWVLERIGRFYSVEGVREVV